MPFKNHNPGCPCCDSACTLHNFDFSEASHLDEFTFDDLLYTWTVSGGKLRTSDANAVIRATTSTDRMEQIATIVATLANEGDSILVRFGWNTTTGSYLWARWTAGAYSSLAPNLSYCGTLEIGDYNTTDGETVLQGPWHVRGAYKTTTMRLRVCYDGVYASARLYPLSGSSSLNSDTIRISAPRDFTHPGGMAVGLETGQAADYEIDSFRVDYQGDDNTDDYVDDPTNCPDCDACQTVNGSTNKTYYDGDPVVWVKSCMWEDAVAGWDQDQAAHSFISDTSGALAWYEKEYLTWPEERQFGFYLALGNDDVAKLYFWYVDANNHYYIKFSSAGVQFYSVVAGTGTLLATAGLANFQYTLYLRYGRIVFVATTQDPIYGTLSYATTELFNTVAYATSTKIGIESTTVDAASEVEFSQWAETCGTTYGACAVCLETSNDDIPDFIEVVIDNPSRCLTANGTYIMERQATVNKGGLFGLITPECTWRMFDPPAQFVEIAACVYTSGGNRYIVVEFTQDLVGTTGRYSSSSHVSKKCSEFDSEQLSPVGGFYCTNVATDAYVTALEND